MTDLDARLRAADELPVPDRWPEIEHREPRRSDHGPTPATRIGIVLLAFAVGAAGFVIAVRAFRASPAPPATELGDRSFHRYTSPDGWSIDVPDGWTTLPIGEVGTAFVSAATVSPDRLPRGAVKLSVIQMASDLPSGDHDRAMPLSFDDLKPAPGPGWVLGLSFRVGGVRLQLSVVANVAGGQPAPSLLESLRHMVASFAPAPLAPSADRRTLRRECGQVELTSRQYGIHISPRRVMAGDVVTVRGTTLRGEDGRYAPSDRIEVWWNTRFPAADVATTKAAGPGPVLLLATEDDTERCRFRTTFPVPNVSPGTYLITVVVYDAQPANGFGLFGRRWVHVRG
jgi:hypothetical protein